MNQTNQSIALISVHGDPATEVKEEAGGQNVYVRQWVSASSWDGKWRCLRAKQALNNYDS